MPQVASEPNLPAFKATAPIPPRPALDSDVAPNLPFASLLDDTATPPPQTPQDPPSPPAPRDKTTAPAQSDSDKPPKDADGAKTAPPAANPKPTARGSGKTVQQAEEPVVNPAKPAANTGQPPENMPAGNPVAANTTMTEQVAATNAPNTTQVNSKVVTNAVDNAVNMAQVESTVSVKPKTIDKDKAGVDARLGVQTKTSGKSKAAAASKPATDGQTVAVAKPADIQTPPVTAADPLPAPVQATTPVAVVIPTAPAPAVTVQAATREVGSTAVGKQIAAVTPDATNVGNTAKVKAGDLAAPQDGANKFAPQDATDKSVVTHLDNEAPTPAPHAAANKPSAIQTDAQNVLQKTSADGTQQASLPAPTPDVTQTTTASTTTPTAPATAPAVAVPIAGVAVAIASQAQAGKNRFEIKLDPPELGRIEVRLDVDRDGHVTSRLIADRSDTLNLLRSDASGLERALQDAGLKTTDNGLQFSLRDQTMGRQQNATPSTPNSAQIVVQDSAAPASDTLGNYSRLAGLRGGIDIRV